MIYVAIDMNHIQHPEVINALGSRIKSVHICDGDGIKDTVLPGRGKNNWNLILQALDGSWL